MLKVSVERKAIRAAGIITVSDQSISSTAQLTHT